MLRRSAAVLAAVLMLMCAGQASAAGALKWKKISTGILQAVNKPILANISSVYYANHTQKIHTTIKKLNRIIDQAKKSCPDVPVYAYFIESSRSLQINKDVSKQSKAYGYVRKELHADKFDRLKVKTVNDLLDWYWTTDHHWCYKGSYQAYLDIMDLMGSGDERAVPSETHVFPFVFNGSLARTLKKPISEQKFTVYLYDGIPNYVTYVNGVQKQHDGINAYLAGNYSTDTYADHYSAFYGPNLGEVIYDTGNADKPNILVITNSFGDPVNQLLTLHYGKVVTINLKHYKKQLSKDFDLAAYIQKYDIRQVLILGDICLYIYPDTI